MLAQCFAEVAQDIFAGTVAAAEKETVRHDPFRAIDGIGQHVFRRIEQMQPADDGQQPVLRKSFMEWMQLRQL